MRQLEPALSARRWPENFRRNSVSQDHIKGAPKEMKGGAKGAAAGLPDESLGGGLDKRKGSVDEMAGDLCDGLRDQKKSRDEVVDVADDDEL
jgi:hypothetical protein